MRELSKSDREKVINTILGEARGEGYLGMAAVAKVIANRAALKGVSLADVVKSTTQFNGNNYRASEQVKVQEAEKALDAALAGEDPAGVGAADHFATNATNTKWTREYKDTANKVGRHTFYNSPKAAKKLSQNKGRTLEGILTSPRSKPTVDVVDVSGRAFTDYARAQANEFQDYGPDFDKQWQDRLAPEMDDALVGTARELERNLGINSGYRSPEYNRAINSARNSQHIYGRASDIDMSGMDAEQRQELVEELAQRGGTYFGTYDRHPDMLHVDTRARPPGAGPHFTHNTSSRHMAGAPDWFRESAASGGILEHNVTDLPVSKPPNEILVSGPSTRPRITRGMLSSVDDLAFAGTPSTPVERQSLPDLPEPTNYLSMDSVANSLAATRPIGNYGPAPEPIRVSPPSYHDEPLTTPGMLAQVGTTPTSKPVEGLLSQRGMLASLGPAITIPERTVTDALPDLPEGRFIPERQVTEPVGIENPITKRADRISGVAEPEKEPRGLLGSFEIDTPLKKDIAKSVAPIAASAVGAAAGPYGAVTGGLLGKIGANKLARDPGYVNAGRIGGGILGGMVGGPIGSVAGGVAGAQFARFAAPHVARVTAYHDRNTPGANAVQAAQAGGGWNNDDFWRAYAASGGGTSARDFSKAEARRSSGQSRAADRSVSRSTGGLY